MDYLKILDAVRSITGRRRIDAFPAAPARLTQIGSDREGPRVWMVFDAGLTKAILESSRYGQFDFLERILTVAPPERTRWIRRFCEAGLIMIDGPEHQRRRIDTKMALDRCDRHLATLPAGTLTALIRDTLATGEAMTAEAVSRRIVTFLFTECITALAGRRVHLPDDAIFSIDFFNPFPTLSSLARCDAAIGACCDAIDFHSFTEAEQATLLALLLMGVSPMHALFTAMLDAAIPLAAAGGTDRQIGDALRSIDAHAVVPTNFVMRRCLDGDALDGETIRFGDIVYLFLGSATGCPFSRLVAVPFGAGRHSCSGAKMTSTMSHLVRDALLSTGRDVAAVTPSEPDEGRASAFLTFRQRTRGA